MIRIRYVRLTETMSARYVQYAGTGAQPRTQRADVDQTSCDSRLRPKDLRRLASRTYAEDTGQNMYMSRSTVHMPITQPTMTASLRRRVLIIESRLLIPGIEPAVHKEVGVEAEAEAEAARRPQ